VWLLTVVRRAVCYNLDVNVRKNIYDLWVYCLSVVLKPWLMFWIFGVPTGVFSFLALVRDNFLSQETQRILATQKYLPQWQWRTWLLVFMTAALCSIVRNGFLIWKRQEARCKELQEELDRQKQEPLPNSAPQVELDSETTSDFPVNRLLVRNISHSEPVYNICFQPLRIGNDIFITWAPETQPVLHPMTIMPLTPIVRTSQGLPIEFKGVYAIVELIQKKRAMLYTKTIQPARLGLGTISFSCEDRVQNRYLVTFEVDVSNSGRDFRVRDLDRKRIGNRPSRT
jgi:hypothetical protein